MLIESDTYVSLVNARAANAANAGAKSLAKLNKGMGLGTSAIESLDLELSAKGFTLPGAYKKLLREMNGFYGPGICFHGSKFVELPDYGQTIEPLKFSQNCNLLQLNRNLHGIYFEEMDRRIVLGESVDYLFAFNDAPSKGCYERLICKSLQMGEEEETPVLRVDRSFKSLSAMLTDALGIKLRSILPSPVEGCAQKYLV